MLKYLTIRNYALIEKLETIFFPGFSVITGETGAGKSIILGALGLILGQRADTTALLNKEEKCVVEGIFTHPDPSLELFFQENQLEWDPEQCIIRREILPSGKSRAFINDSPVNLNQLKELTENLIDIHSQNEVTVLQQKGFQLNALDVFAGIEQSVKQFSELFHQLQSARKLLHQLEDQENELSRQNDYFRFQFEELQAAALQDNEQEELEHELRLLTNAEEIKHRILAAEDLLNRDGGLLQQFRELTGELRQVARFDPAMETVISRLDEFYPELKELVYEITRLNDRLEVDPRRSGEINERLSLIYHLQQKHRVNSIAELKRVQEDFRRKLEEYQSLSGRIEEVKSEIYLLEQKTQEMASWLSTRRQEASVPFSEAVLEIIRQLGMPFARFETRIEPARELHSRGKDDVVFYFTANKGSELQELSKVASGGELSRLLLAIKAVLANRISLPAIIFDEIDTGISGEIAGKMGQIMKKMGAHMQVIAITHLPQIAARGVYHYLVYKEHDQDQSRTYIRQIAEEERVQEIARMLSDSVLSASALETARELMKN